MPAIFGLLPAWLCSPAGCARMPASRALASRATSAVMTLHVARRRARTPPHSGRDTRLQPHRRVVERGTAVGWNRIAADQRVDAGLFLERIERPDALDDQRVGLLSTVVLGFEHDRATGIADAHAGSLLDAVTCCRAGVDADARTPLL